MQFGAISFDADQTLWDFHGVYQQADDWDDIEGAHLVGATSVFINRTDTRPGWAADADHEVTDLVELEALLRMLSGRNGA